jgi:uncharacterized membrane protein (Fun14 family)
MSDTVAPSKLGFLGFLVKHYSPLAGWKKLLLMMATVFCVLGVSGQGLGLFRKEVRTDTVNKTADYAQRTIDGVSAVDAAQVKAKAQEVIQQAHWFYDRISPGMWHTGLTFIVAFVVGYMLRRALAWVITISSLCLIGVGVAWYMGWADLQNWFQSAADSGKAVSTFAYDSARWLLSKVAAGTAGMVGLFIGFLKSK